ncbi:hypothetical protein LF1_20940 [Rubripirellula obstinata]|uniref:DUF4332 domain-containing protein n=1 Tax=Rubripirellula obstinata TaxID=406547 RepID=A0A5B1CIX2_9BACT|nr:DUF4332 domain-containing protein [Rubripirellula obstinata]KAA1259560.1 hypothetical protein LF1_20940 [Rubripirellula obstinata]
MLRSFLRLFSAPTAPKPIEMAGGSITLYAKVPLAENKPKSIQKSPAHQTAHQHAHQHAHQPAGNHRQRVLSMKIAHIGICSPQRAKRLAALNLISAGDLAVADPSTLAKHFGAPRKAASMLRHYRRAIRLAASVPGMMPRDAMLLVSVHRRSIRGLASETPGSLYRDLQRFAESSQGRSLLRGRRLPSTRRIKQWITQCEAARSNRPAYAQAA